MQQNAKSLLFLRLGLVALVIANTFTYVLNRTHAEMDFISGMLFGLSFTLLIMSLVRRNDIRPSREA
jgi:uncharacterized membrane protein